MGTSLLSFFYWHTVQLSTFWYSVAGTSKHTLLHKLMDFMINADIVVLVWLTLNSDFILGKQQCVHICDNQAWTSIVDSNLYFWLFLFWILTLTSIFTFYRHFVIFSWYSFVFCDMNLGVYKVDKCHMFMVLNEIPVYSLIQQFIAKHTHTPV